MNGNIKKLRDLGQSLWYDNMQRRLLTGGRMKEMIAEGWVQGVTSNPSIFQKAIVDSDDYNHALKKMAAEGLNADAIYLGLVEEDIRTTADLLRGVYEQTDGRDGYVSLEVSPKWARNAKETIAEALSLVARLDRPNVMIKVPGTPEGLEAIRELTRQGVSINVTLLFSMKQYEAIAQAYLSGLEARLEDGQRIHKIASVASFFVSRVDTLIDRRLDESHPDRAPALKGKAAIANSKLVYQRGLEIFSGARWEAIEANGGRAQRLLWASTSTKNPAYSDTLYVDELIGPNTVNTLPPSTLDAFADHGHPALSLTRDLDAARAHIAAIEALGIDMNEVGETLQNAGVDAFRTSMETLMQVIDTRRKALVR